VIVSGAGGLWKLLTIVRCAKTAYKKGMKMDIVKIVVAIWQALPDNSRREIIENLEEDIGKLLSEIFRLILEDR